MRVYVSLAVLLAAGVAVSGCFGGGGSKGTGGSGSFGGPDVGVLEGLVTDDEVNPLGEAMIAIEAPGFSLLKITANSSADGFYRFSDLQPGPKDVVVSKAGFYDLRTNVDVRRGETIRKDFALVRLPGLDRKVAEQAAIQGGFTCAAEWGQGGGSCDGPLPAEQRQFDTNNELPFTVPTDWGGILLELEWQVGSGAETIQGLRLEIRAENGTGRYAYVESIEKHLRIALDAGTRHSATDLPYPLATDGENVTLVARPIGLGADATCSVQCLGGFGAALDLKFCIVPTLFFGMPVDPTYTAFTDDASCLV